MSSSVAKHLTLLSSLLSYHDCHYHDLFFIFEIYDRYDIGLNFIFKSNPIYLRLKTLSLLLLLYKEIKQGTLGLTFCNCVFVSIFKPIETNTVNNHQKC
jgi:hypothetical protein